MAKKAKSAPSFDKDIRPLFDKRAVDQMKSIAGFDLLSSQTCENTQARYFSACQPKRCLRISRGPPTGLPNSKRGWMAA